MSRLLLMFKTIAFICCILILVICISFGIILVYLVSNKHNHYVEKLTYIAKFSIAFANGFDRFQLIMSNSFSIEVPIAFCIGAAVRVWVTDVKSRVILFDFR